MFYLWKDKQSTEKKTIVYITDYKEIKPDGKVYVDEVGLVEAELVFQNQDKMKCVSRAQRMVEK